MILLAVSLVLMRMYATASGSCGPGPNVAFFNYCTVGPVHVDWNTTCDLINDCKAYWRCTNGTAYHNDESSPYTCRTRGFDFEIPWEHYLCNVTVFYQFDNKATRRDELSASTTKSCSNNLIQVSDTDSFEVGETHEVNCTVYAVNSGDVSISWTGPNGNITVSEDSRISVLPSNFSSNGYIHTSTLQFSHIKEEDENTLYNCSASISGKSEALLQSFNLTNLTIPPPIVSVRALDSNPIIGKPFPMECNVTVAKGVDSGVDIIWKVNETDLDRENNTLMDTYTIPSLQLEDNNTVYYCEAMISTHEYVTSSANITVSNISLVQPIVSVTQLNINESLSLECNVTLTRGIVGNVSITWKANNTTKNVTIKEISPEQVSYIDHYQYSPLGLSHNNTVYHCEAVISNSTLLKSNASIIIELPTTNDTATTNTEVPPSTRSSKDTSSSAILIMPSIAAVVVGVLAVGLIVYVIFKGKKYIKFLSSASQDDHGLAVIPIDDIYSVTFRGETSTIDFEYLKANDKVKKWLEMPALEEECSSICSPSVANEIMLDCVVNGHHTKENITISTHDTNYKYSTGSDNFNSTKNDNGYYSSSSESVSQECGSYISEKAAFSRDAEGKVQKCHLDNVIEEEGLIQSSESQNNVAFPIKDGDVTLEDQNCSCLENAVEIKSSKQDDDFSKNATSSQKNLSSSAEGVKNNGKLPLLSEEHYVPHTTEEIQLTSNSLISPVSTEENCENVSSPTISDGEYIPYTAAVNLSDYTAIATPLDSNHHMQQNCTTGIYNAVPMAAVKQETVIAENFSNVDGDQSHTFSHTNAAVDEMTTPDINNVCDKIRVADVKPYLRGSSSDIFPSASMEGQDEFAYCTINGDRQSINNDVCKFDGDPSLQVL